MFSLDAFSLLGGDRAIRKRQQVDNIVSVLTKHGLDAKSVVVDFGSGSGNLCLALASVFTLTTFVFVDMNQTSLDILSQRSRVAGLTNIKVIKFRFTEENLQEFLEKICVEVGVGMDLGIGLHSCGSFTDLVMEVCRLASSDCLIVPCCNGKIDLDQAWPDILANTFGVEGEKSGKYGFFNRISNHSTRVTTPAPLLWPPSSIQKITASFHGLRMTFRAQGLSPSTA